MSRTTDFGDSGVSAIHGWVRRVDLVASPRAAPASAWARSTSSSSSIRSSYSMPSAFISATASPAGLELLGRPGPAAGPPASPPRPRPRRGRRSATPASSVSKVASAYVRQRLVQREVELEVLDQPAACSRPIRHVCSDDAGREQAAVLRDRPPHQPHLAAAVLVVVAQQRCRSAPNGSPSRASTLSSIEWVTRIRDTSGSGVSGDQPLERRPRSRSRSPRAASCAAPCAASWGRRRPWRRARAFSTTWSGACTTTAPAVS